MNDIPSDADIGAQVIAFVSGKGGSGKTLIAATVANHLAQRLGQPIYVIDADLATGGMTYYLGFKIFQRTAVGFSDVILAVGRSDVERTVEVAFSAARSRRFKLMPVGDHRALMRTSQQLSWGSEDGPLATAFRRIVKRAISESGGERPIVLVDCRGGMDDESVEICRQASDIILVAETDATSIQASQHLVDILSDRNVSSLLRGFILNKVFDNPSQLAKAGASLFRCSYLGAVPFDLSAVRNYIQGELPSEDGLFSRQISAIVGRRFEEFSLEQSSAPLLDDDDFARLSLDDPDERLGSMFVAATLLYVGAVAVALYRSPEIYFFGNKVSTQFVLTVGAVAAGLIGSAKHFRRSLGRILRGYLHIYWRLLKTINR
jgi:septum site-determining protein MinD